MVVGSRRDHIRALLVASDADDSVRFPDHLDKGSNALRNDQGASAEVRGAPGGWPPRGDKAGPAHSFAVTFHPLIPHFLSDQAVGAAARRRCRDVEDRQIPSGDLQYQLTADRRDEF